jgi:cation:H+ antiporter
MSLEPGAVGFFVAGLVLLVVGAEALVRGASRLALAAGVSPLVVGLTVVALGTSSPEMAVTVEAALEGGSAADLALGNVVGSNIFNVLFILGVSAAIAPLVVHRQLVRLDVPVMIGTSCLVPLLGYDGVFGRLDGLLLVSGAVAYTAFLVVQSRRESKAVAAEYEHALGAPPRRVVREWIVNGALVAVGLGLLVLGAGWLVDASVSFARVLGVSELVIGLTIVAAGTSMPEVATSIVATLRGERDIAVGNVVGSSIFNVLGVLGLASALSPTGVGVAPAALAFDVPVMLAVAVACLPIFFTDHLIARRDGILFLAYYVAYTTYLILASQQHDALPAYSAVMFEFVIPLTSVTICVLAFRAWRRGRASGGAPA